MSDMSERFQVFSTCAQSSRFGAADYRSRVIEVARWCDRYGYDGILVHDDHSLVDPWIVANEIVNATEHLSPLVAVQPTAMPPYSVAKMLASFSFLHGRRLFLNLVAGGFRGDLQAIGDETPHGRRYERLREFTEIVMALAAGETVTRRGEWYTANGLKLAPPIPEELRPGLLMSGSSPAGLATAATLGATAIQSPEPAGEETAEVPDGVTTGIRVGIIARDDAEVAWRVAHDRFPPSRRGELLHEMAVSRSDSPWHSTLSQLAAESASAGNAYWLGPFENYDTFCPYLVGTYDDVADVLVADWRAGHRAIILDIPTSEEDFEHTAVVFERVRSLVAAG
jgi:alkanesulfonate monooxygenase